MKRRFTILTAALALLAFLAIPMGMKGQTTEDVTLSSGTFNDNVITWNCADGNITIQQLKGSGSTNPSSSYISAPRVYKQNILSFVGTNGYTITNIDIKCNGAYYGTTKYAGTEISNNDVSNNTTALNPTWSTANGGTHTIATVSNDGLSEIYIQNGHSSDANTQLRITQLTITYKVTGSVTATTVTINTSGLTNTDVYTSTTAGTLTASVTETESGDAISGATVAWSSSNTDVATIDNNGAVTLVAVGTTTITASYAGGNGYGSSSATYELTVTSSEPYVQPTTIEIVPNYEFWGKTGQFSGNTYNELDGSQDNVSLHWTRGSGSTYANSTAMRFYKDNNLTFTAPEGYEIKSIVITFSTTQEDLTFSPEGYSLSGTTGTWTGSSAIVTMSRPSNASSYAQISMFTITIGLPTNDPSVTVTPNTIEATSEGAQGTLTVAYENMGDSYDADVEFFEADGETQATYSWLNVTINEDDNIDYVILANDGAARTAYLKVLGQYGEGQEVYSNLVTISQAAYVAPFEPATYTLATSIESGKTYIIVNQESNVAMGVQNSNNRAGVNVVIANESITVTSDEVYEFVIESAGENVYSIYDARYNNNAGGYLYAASNSSNYLKTEAELDEYGNGNWAISIDAFNDASIVAQGPNGRNNMRFNANNGSPIFSCYASTSNLPKVSLYVKDETPATETYTLENITGYTGEKDHYFLIASPVNVDPATVGMTTGDFDLYYFDESQELEWRNYEATPFNLVPGTGYLYAKKATTENQTYSFELTGTPYSGNGMVDLAYTENAEFAGFNLIGNPFNTNATLDKPYYRLSQDGSALNTTTESSEINVMEGVFVQATAANQSANFTMVSNGAKKISQLNIKVTRNRSAVLDNAIIRFDEGATLNKFQLNANSTKLYFTEGNQDFAVVRSANEGEMPVNFKAAENGTYTISINAENVDVNYLHLIDNMTGADVDLLATPSYSFEAKVTDYASRFRLVFNANSGVNEQNSETFAFFNGNNLVINNEGEATLQVIDMMGRTISSEQISGSYNNSLNLSAGVYVLRLSNGNTVKTQKIVID